LHIFWNGGEGVKLVHATDGKIPLTADVSEFSSWRWKQQAQNIAKHLNETYGVIAEWVTVQRFRPGTAVAQWLRCCATNRKVTGSIPDGVTGIFHWHNPSDRTMALGSTQPLTSNRIEYQEDFLGVNAAGAYGWQSYHHPAPLSWNLGTVTSWNPLGHSRPVTGLIYLYLPFTCFGQPCAHNQEKITLSMRHWHLSLWIGGVWSAGWI
jgi:hypothetical protein